MLAIIWQRVRGIYPWRPLSIIISTDNKLEKWRAILSFSTFFYHRVSSGIFFNNRRNERILRRSPPLLAIFALRE